MAEFEYQGKGRWLKIVTPGSISSIDVKGISDANHFTPFYYNVKQDGIAIA